MVIPTILRCITRRSVLAVLATTVGVGLTSELAAQSSGPVAPITGPVPEFDFLDIPLAEGERIVSSSLGEGGPVIQYEGGSYRLVDPSGVPTAAGGHRQAKMPSTAAGFPLTGHCASGNCGAGGCGTCGNQRGRIGHGGYVGPGAGLDLGGHAHRGSQLGGRPRLGAGGNVCGPTCNPYHYAAFDALYMTNNGVENVVGTAPFSVSDYDYELGMRITIGSVPDCHRGYEATFVGPFRWTSSSQGGPVRGINTLLVPGPGVDLSNFENAIEQNQRFEAEYLSFELNRTMIGWDVIKLLYGVRYIQYDEEYLYRTNIFDPLADQGRLRSETENRMIGGQVGVDMTYPVTCRLWSDFRARAGAYANFSENTFQVDNGFDAIGPIAVVYNEDSDTRLAGMFELGGGARYYVTNNFHIRGGGELWYLSGIAAADRQFNSLITLGSGQPIRNKSDIFMFGFSVGGEWKF